MLATLAEIISGFSIIFGGISGTFDLISHAWGWAADINDGVQGVLYWIDYLIALFSGFFG